MFNILRDFIKRLTKNQSKIIDNSTEPPTEEPVIMQLEPMERPADQEFDIVLDRWAFSPFGTFGTLSTSHSRVTYHSVERPWADNAPRVSCIPNGVYTGVWYNSPTFGRTIALIGRTVSLFPEPGKQRSAILFHVGNTMDDLQGCIALGNGLGFLNGKWAVTSSRPAITEFLNSLPNRDLRVLIRNTPNTPSF